MDFFNHIYLDNSIKNYCFVTGGILLVILLKRYVSRYLASLVFRLVHRFRKNISKANFIDLVVQPLGWFLVILITVFTIDKLNFPEEWRYKIYGHDTQEILNRTGMGIIIVSFTVLILRFIDFIALVLEQRATLTEEKNNEQLIVFFRDFLKVLISIIGVLLLIKACFNQPIGNLLTSLSIVGAVVALAAKESLENLIASFIIFFDKPFTPGDTLKVNAVAGTVERIGLRSTRIRTGDKTLVTVPNKQMVDSVVDNLSMRTHRRGEIRLELSSQTPASEVQALIAAFKQLLNDTKGNFTSASVHLTDFSKTGLVITVEFFTQSVTPDMFSQIKEDTALALKILMEERNIELSSSNTSEVIPKSE